MAGLTLDAGAVIGFERDDRRVVAHLKAALLAGREVTVPAVVVAEAWRGGPRSARIARLLAGCVVESVGETLARAAGEAMAKVSKAGTIDALVMACAARRGDAVLTSDPDDLTALQLCFPKVRVIAIG
ncbi:MAG: PIN domain-containing protein [Rubrivivax sp.]